MLDLGVIGYGVRMDMLMDNLFSLDREVRVKAVADHNPRRVRDLMTKDESAAERYAMELDKIDANLRECRMDPDGITFYHDADDMLEQERLDGVLIGTGCNTHAMLAKKVLDRNLPLFLEKPVGVCQEDLDLLKACSRKPHAPVVVSFPLRVTNLIQEVKRILDAGTIGKVEHVQAYNDVGYGFVYYHDWYRNESISHGLFLQKATHDVDVINYLTGETPVSVCAMKSKQIFKGDMPAGLRCSQCEKQDTCMESSYNIVQVRNDTPRSDWCCYARDTGNEDSGTLILRYESGMHAMYSQNFFARKAAARRGARLYGYKGTVEFDFVSQKIFIYDHMSDKVTQISVPIPARGHGGGDTALMKNFADRWRRENYVFAPGAVYHGNRFACRKLPYPPYAPLPPEEAGGGYYAVGVRRDIPPAVLAGGLDRRRHKQLRFPAGGPGARQGARPGNLPLHLRPAPDGKRLGLRDVWKRRVLWGYL